MDGRIGPPRLDIGGPLNRPSVRRRALHVGEQERFHQSLLRFNHIELPTPGRYEALAAPEQ